MLNQPRGAAISPLPDESLLGFIRRLAEVRAYPSTTSFLSGLGFRYGRRLVEHLDEFETAVGLAKGTLDLITPRAGAVDPALDWRFERTRSAPVCPRCVSEGLPHQKGWRHALVTACVKHGVRLADKCPRCNARLTPNDGSSSSCSCGFRYGLIECIPAEPGELVIASLITGETGRERGLLPYSLQEEAPPDIARFIFFLASQSQPSRTAKHGKLQIPTTVDESRSILADTAAILTDWPHRFDDHVRERLLKGSSEAASAPARLGSWYQGLMRFKSKSYAPFRERVAHVVALHFDGPYAGHLSNDITDASWVSVAEAARLLQVGSDRIRAGISAGALTARVFTSGFGHCHSLVRRDDIEAIAKARRRFIDRRAAAKLLGVTRAQMRLLEDADLVHELRKEDRPAFVDGGFDADSIAELHELIASRASARTGEVLAFREINLRRTTDRSSLIRVIQAIRDGAIIPVARGEDLGLTRFAKADITNALRQTSRGEGWTTREVACITGWKEQCIAHWCRIGLLCARPYSHARTTAFIVSPSDLSAFQAAYIPLAVLAKQTGSSSRALLARFARTGVAVHGTFRDGQAVRGHLLKLSDLVGMLR